MANDVTVGIHAETDVPQAANKSKEAMTQMERAVEGLNKKMEGFGKDLVLSYIAPMVLLNKAIDFVMAKIEEHQQKIKDSFALAETGQSKFLAPEVSSTAREASRLEREKKEKELAGMAPAAVTEKMLVFNDEIFNRVMAGMSERKRDVLLKSGMTREQLAGGLSLDPEVQKMVFALSKTGPTSFDTLGVQNAVFGMGTISPLQVAMTAQLEESQRQTALLQKISDNQPKSAEQIDYTKRTVNGFIADRARPF